MKKAIILFLLFLLFGTLPLLAQDRWQIAVKASELNNGVVIITAQQGRTPVELQCNKGALDCKLLEAGTYVMVRLPKNRGMYMCQNVDVFAISADPLTSDKIGQYCLIEK